MRVSLRDAALAARDGRAYDIRDYLAAGGHPDDTDETKIRLLHIAAARRQVEVVRLLIEAGADVNAIDYDGRSPLYEAIADSFPDPAPTDRVANSRTIVAMLLDAGANPDAGGHVPLAVAAQRNDIDIVQRLIGAHAEVNIAEPREFSTPLLSAVNYADPQIVSMFLALGADPNDTDRRGQSPLIRAVYAPSLRQNSQQRRTECLRMLQELITAGADTDHVAIDGTTALFAAVNEAWLAAFDALLTAGADARLVTARGGLWHIVVDAAARQPRSDEINLEWARRTRSAGADPLAVDDVGRTAVEYAHVRRQSSLADAFDRRLSADALGLLGSLSGSDGLDQFGIGGP